jgi:hypothetical protein
MVRLAVVFMGLACQAEPHQPPEEGGTMPTAIEYGLQLPTNATVSLAQNGAGGGPPAQASTMQLTEPTAAIWVAVLLAVVAVGVRHLGQVVWRVVVSRGVLARRRGATRG